MLCKGLAGNVILGLFLSVTKGENRRSHVSFPGNNCEVTSVN